ncbi:fimbrial protein [Pantoea sp. AS142]|uniref:fimbrial protein n=1 Tax=Pantoea sp. AS142 TaxID=3081292 RepID=UPI003015E418
MIKLRYKLGVVFLFHLPIFFAQAYTGQCLMPGGTTNSMTADLKQFDVTNPSHDRQGYVVVKDFQFVASGLPYRARCDNDKKASTPIFLTTNVPLPGSGSGWYQLNDYLSVKSQTWIDGGRQIYIENPMKSESNQLDQENGQETDWRTGGKGKISIRIDHPFVGFSAFNKDVLEVYANTFKDGVSQQPLTVLFISGSVVVPQSCEVNAGQIITMDFGNIAASAFSQAGAGNKPAGTNPQTRNIGIKCNNIDAQALLSLRIEANKVTGNALVSDKSDLGFVIADGNYNPLTPNNIGSNIPFRLDENASANVAISAWPVSVTGNKPAEGRFTSEGYLRVDFD